MSATALSHAPVRRRRSDRADRRSRTSWSPDRIAALRRFFDEGLSHELMAQRLNTTKGAVSAKIDRLEWVRTATIISLKPERRAHVAMAKDLANTTGCTLANMTDHQCRWPLALLGEQTFCGAKRAAPSWYCQPHEARSRVRSNVGKPV